MDEPMNTVSEIFDHNSEVKAVMVEQRPSDTSVRDTFNCIKKAMIADFGYAWSWHCNLAMAIYDESHPNCICGILDNGFKGHREGCGVLRAEKVGSQPLSHEFCNNAAARFMKLCFDVDTSETAEQEHFGPRKGTQ